jgi:hypothetical protein
LLILTVSLRRRRGSDYAESLTQVRQALLDRRPACIQPDVAELAWQDDDPTAHQAVVHQATGILVQLGGGRRGRVHAAAGYAYA